jgi:RND family efflux transporter MFP subunit
MEVGLRMPPGYRAANTRLHLVILKESSMFPYRVAAIAFLAVTLVGCGETAPKVSQPRPVRTVTVGRRAEGETVSLTGQIRAQNETSLAFRLDGRLIERRVNVGDVVKLGQVVGRLDAQIQQNSLQQAQANLSAAQGQLQQARSTFARQQELLKQAITSRAQFEQAQQALQTAEAQVNSGQAQLQTAQDQLSYTELQADSAGTVTAIGAEPGEVVAAGRMIVKIAHDGGRDAVFDVPAHLIRTASRDVVVEVAMTDDPSIKAIGSVREVAPQADAATRTFQIKIGLIDPPDAMRLGATVTGRVTLRAPVGHEIPASALTQANGRAAVWVVAPDTQTVSLRNVEVLRYDPANIVVSKGLESGEIVVTAGAQVLRPDQKVRLLGDVK